MSELPDEIRKIDVAISAQESLHGILPNEQLDAALSVLREKRAIIIAQQNISGGINAQADTLNISGDAVGRDKIVSQTESTQYTATNTGSGSIAQGTGAISAGEHGIAAQSIGHGNILLTGDNNRVNVGDDPQVKLLEARRRYLLRLRRACEALPLAALGGEEAVDEDVTLESIYIGLDTTTPAILHKKDKKSRPEQVAVTRAGNSRRLTALEAAAQFPRLVLLGDPGAGNSTFVRNLLAWLAAAQLGESDPPLGFAADLLPILIVLRDLTPRLAALNLDDRSDEEKSDALAAAVREQVLAELDRFEAAAFTAGLSEALNTGRCLLVLDGLDEVPYDLRGRMRQAAAAVIRCYRLQRVIVTCRIRSYAGEALLPNFQVRTLAPFDPDKIQRFANAWYNTQKNLGHIDAEQARHKADNLTEVALSPDLEELSSNPMMLTTMAIIHQREIGLPKERVRLYSLAVDVLLRRWQKRKTGDAGLVPSPELAEFLKDDLRLRRVMERLAYEAHRVGRGRQVSADLSRGDGLTLLEHPDYLREAGLAAEFLDYVDQRAGLLVGRGGEPHRPATYSFPHRVFQEYLAGCYLIGQRDVAREYFARASEGDYWSLATQLGAEELMFNRRVPNTLLDLAYQLCPASEPVSNQTRRTTLWSGNLATLAGREMIERDTASPDGGPVYLQRLIPRLVSLLTSDLTASERADAGVALAHLGDPRLEAMTIEQMLFCYVPRGLFWLGSENVPDDSFAFDEEKPQHQFDIPYDYWLARYPITNAQFAAFVDDGGYKVHRYWQEAAAVQAWQAGFVQRRIYRIIDGEEKLANEDQSVDEVADSPHDFGYPFNLPNHPVVGVNWYEALAFTRWLDELLHNAGRVNDHYQVRLPTEAEWEKAARGGLEILAKPIIAPLPLLLAPEFQWQKNNLPRRLYPWGNSVDKDRVSFGETGIGATCAVGVFIKGRSSYGCEDLSGNVWEWCMTKSDDNYEDYRNDNDPGGDRDEDRRLRGGSFDDGKLIVRCAMRNRASSDGRLNCFGLRVAVAPLQEG